MQKNDYLELIRFIVSLLIMITHLSLLGIPYGTYAFTYSWIYVEFFFMVTGYFSTRHFVDSGSINVLDKLKNSVVYTVKKFWKYVPYSIVIVPCAYCIVWWPLIQSDVTMLYYMLRYIIPEVFFLSEIFRYPIISGTLWFLSAMLAVFPVYCIILQIHNNSIKFILTGICGAAYYGIFGFTGERVFPHDLLRAFSGLCLGTVIFYLSRALANVKTTKKEEYLFTIAETIAFAATLIISGFNLSNMLMIALFMFIITLSIMFSGKSYTSNIKCKLFRWLGQLSLPIFMWQWTWEAFILQIGRAHV